MFSLVFPASVVEFNVIVTVDWVVTFDVIVTFGSIVIFDSVVTFVVVIGGVKSVTDAMVLCIGFSDALESLLRSNPTGTAMSRTPRRKMKTITAIIFSVWFIFRFLTKIIFN